MELTQYTFKINVSNTVNEKVKKKKLKINFFYNFSFVSFLMYGIAKQKLFFQIYNIM